jgi:hypothetical protein
MTAAQLPAEGRAAQRAEGHVRRPSFEPARQQCNQVMDYLRRHGPFEPHRLPLDEMEYTTMPSVAERLADPWEAAEVSVPTVEPEAAAPGVGGASSSVRFVERRPGRAAGEQRVVVATDDGRSAGHGLWFGGNSATGLRRWATWWSPSQRSSPRSPARLGRGVADGRLRRG